MMIQAKPEKSIGSYFEAMELWFL